MMPANADYYHAAYIAAAVIYVGYGVALWRRTRRLREREASLSSSGESGATERRR